MLQGMLIWTVWSHNPYCETWCMSLLSRMLLLGLHMSLASLHLLFPGYHQCKQKSEVCVCVHWAVISCCLYLCMRRCRSQMCILPFLYLTHERQPDDCFSSRVTNSRTSIGFAAGRGILAVVRHLANSLIEVIHTHPSTLVLSNKPGWKPAIRNCWNHGRQLSALMSQSKCYRKLFNRGVID